MLLALRGELEGAAAELGTLGGVKDVVDPLGFDVDEGVFRKDRDAAEGAVGQVGFAVDHAGDFAGCDAVDIAESEEEAGHAGFDLAAAAAVASLSARTIRAVLPAMLERKAGRIIAFGSIAGIALVPNMGGYCATKAAVNVYLEVLQNELRDSGVRAHLVCPPAVNTPLIDQTLETDTPGSILESKNSGRLADPEKIVDAIEKGVRKDKDIIYPGEARLLYLWRALFPGLWWKTVMKFEKK